MSTRSYTYRWTDDDERLIAALATRLHETKGAPVTHTDAIRAGLQALKRELDSPPAPAGRPLTWVGLTHILGRLTGLDEYVAEIRITFSEELGGTTAILEAYTDDDGLNMRRFPAGDIIDGLTQP